MIVNAFGLGKPLFFLGHGITECFIDVYFPLSLSLLLVFLFCHMDGLLHTNEYLPIPNVRR